MHSYRSAHFFVASALTISIVRHKEITEKEDITLGEIMSKSATIQLTEFALRSVLFVERKRRKCNCDVQDVYNFIISSDT